MKSRGIAVLLALFLGGLGVHKFYLNQVGQGFLYLVFFWTFIPAILGVIDALRYAFMSNDKFYRKYTYEPPTPVAPAAAPEA